MTFLILMNDQIRRYPAVGEPGAPSVMQVFIFIALWPAFLPLVMGQMHCYPFLTLKPIAYAVAAICTLCFVLYRFFTLRKSGYLAIVKGQQIPISRFKALLGAFVGGGFVFCVSGLFSWMLIGDLVLFTSHERHEYVAQITDVFLGGRGCHRNMEFMDDTVKRPISMCADSFVSMPTPGELIKVRIMSGPLGVRFITAAR